ncbi:L-threonine 3-dehydrogenase-like [Sycon ciliatum]|uniref:L-threonine 3-dehydrogenase-like n=1 Tax=Sycon ciliatum TaxID=27933 RepID=UPI0020A937BE|eukprot:scpid62179/ scgid29990/ L-threonine 3-dehydrogenase
MAAVPDSMTGLLKSNPTKSYDLTTLPVPKPESGELLVKVLRASICGSDIMLYNWTEGARVIASLPFTPGHECVAEIVSVGSDVGAEFEVGKRVCCENHYYCGHCYQCTHDQRHICQNLSQYGHGKGTVHGGCSQYSIIPARYAYLLKTSLDNDIACLLEPFGVAHQACEALEPSGDTVLVQGCGPIGIFCVALCNLMGASKIIVTDIVDDKLELARTFGATVLVNGLKENLKEAVMRETGGDGVGRLVEASGVAPMLNNCFTLLRKGGTVLAVGLPKAPLHVENPLPDVMFKSLTLRTVHGRKIFSTWEKSEEILASGKIDISPVITHRFPLTKFEDAFAALFSGAACKIILDPQT